MAQRTVALCDGKFIGIESIYTVIDGKQINIPDKLEQLRAKSRNNELFCPCGCGANLVLVAGERNLREQHFRIKEGFDGICQMPVEGINSIDSKIALKCWLEDKLHTDDIESRVPIRTVSESERKYEFTFLSAKKKVALSFCNEYRNLSDDKFTILEQHSNGNSIIYVASGDKSETNGQYPEGLMKIQKRQGYCLLLNVDGADYSKAELTVVYYEKNADGVWEKVNIARDKLSKFDISDSSQIMYHNHSLSDMLKEKQLEFNKHKQAIIYQRELDKIHAEEAWRADEERRKQARIKAEKDRKAELERKDYEMLMQWSKVFLMNKSFTTFSGATSSRALLFPMESVYESYVAQQMKKVMSLEGWDVSSQDKGHYLFTEPRRQFALRPDIVMKRGERTVILDTKWKSLVDNERVNYGISQADMYQMYAYSKKYNTPEIWLLYPVNDEMRNHYPIRFESGDGITVNLHFVDVDKIEESLQELRSKLEEGE